MCVSTRSRELAISACHYIDRVNQGNPEVQKYREDMELPYLAGARMMPRQSSQSMAKYTVKVVMEKCCIWQVQQLRDEQSGQWLGLVEKWETIRERRIILEQVFMT